MPVFLVRNKDGSPATVEAPSFDAACDKLGWNTFECTGEQMKEDSPSPNNAWEKVEKPDMPAIKEEAMTKQTTIEKAPEGTQLAFETVVKIDISLIAPNPYQPASRLHPPEDIVDRIAASIGEFGLLQTPVVRKVSDDKYEMGDGWIRLCGYRHLARETREPEWHSIPVTIRELTDRQMADLVMEANTVRHDLTPIDLAKFYKKYLEDFGATQKELAEIHNVSQGEIANTIRLLDLPEDIQGKIISREISETHGRQLLRLNKLPDLQQKLIKETIKDNMSVNELDHNIHETIWRNSKSLNPRADHWDRPSFDIKECENCELKETATEPYGSRKKELRCLKPECWEKKNTASIKEKLEKAKGSAKASGVVILTNKELPHDKRADLGEYSLKHMDNPEECVTCSKTALYKFDLASKGESERVCIDPACHRAKQAKKTRDDNKLNKILDGELTEKLGEILRHSHENPLAALLVIARHELGSYISADAKRDLLKIFPDELPKLSNGQLDSEQLHVNIESMSLDALLQLLVAEKICSRRRGGSSGDKYSTKLTAELELDVATLNGTLESYLEKVVTWQERNCRGCGHAKEKLISTGHECCDWTYAKKIDKDGDCQSSPAMLKLKGNAGGDDEDEFNDEDDEDDFDDEEGCPAADEVDEE